MFLSSSLLVFLPVLVEVDLITDSLLDVGVDSIISNLTIDRVFSVCTLRTNVVHTTALTTGNGVTAICKRGYKMHKYALKNGKRKTQINLRYLLYMLTSLLSSKVSKTK